MFRGSPRTSVLKTGPKLSTATLSLLCVELVVFVLIRQMVPLTKPIRTLSVCHAGDAMLIRFHVEMPSAPYNIATLDAHFLCG